MLLDYKAIAEDLYKTALNEGYYGRALTLALDIPKLTVTECDVLIRYLSGTQMAEDHITLQEIAYKVRNLQL